MSKLTKLVKHPRQFVLDMRALQRFRPQPSSRPFSPRSTRDSTLHPDAVGWSLLESWVEELPASWTFEAHDSPTIILLESGFRRMLDLAREVSIAGGRVRFVHGTESVDPTQSNDDEVFQFVDRQRVFQLSVRPNVGKPDVVVDVELWSLEEGSFEAPRPNRIARRTTEKVAREHGLFESGRSAMLESLHPSPLPEDPAFPVDVVYTWVNHLDPDWRQLRADATNTELEHEKDDARSLARFLSRDELKYSIRSVLEFAPWVGRIWIVSNCSPPTWLDLRHPKIAWVDHAAILPADALPTFSSHAIESRLQHIPGLANHFVYFNDDFFLLRTSRKWDFFHGNGMSKSFMEPYGAVSGSSAEGDPDYLNAARNGRDLIERAFGRSVTCLHKHTPYALRRDVLLEMEARFSNEIHATTRSQFRTPADISTVSFLYHHYAYLTHRGIYSARRAALLKPTTDDCIDRMSEYLDGKRVPLTLCLNDGAGTAENADWDDIVTRFLRAYFPVPSETESNTPDVLERELSFPSASIVIPLEHPESLSLDRLSRWLRELPDEVELIVSSNPMGRTALKNVAERMRRPRVRLYVQPGRATLGELLNFGAVMSLSERIVVLSGIDACDFRTVRALEDSLRFGDPKPRVHAAMREDGRGVAAAAFAQTALSDVGYFVHTGLRGVAEFVERCRTRWGDSSVRIAGESGDTWPWRDAGELQDLRDWHYSGGLMDVAYPPKAELSILPAIVEEAQSPNFVRADDETLSSACTDFDGVYSYEVPSIRRPLSSFCEPSDHEVLCIESKPRWFQSVETALIDLDPLVSVILTAFEAEDTIEGALRSLTNQSHQHLEILVVDDCSSDGTRAIIERLAAADARIRVLSPERNSGTYVCRNIALEEARGEFVTFADADDVSTAPRIRLQAALLMSDPTAPATTVCFQRRDEEHRVRWVTRQKDRSALVSMMFRREEIRERLGYFDSVRVNADNEFKERMIACWQGVRMRRLPATYYFALFASGSLTTSGVAPIHYEGRSPRLSRPREQYARAAKSYHDKILAGTASAYIAFPLDDRPFDAPEELLP